MRGLGIFGRVLNKGRSWLLGMLLVQLLDRRGGWGWEGFCFRHSCMYDFWTTKLGFMAGLLHEDEEEKSWFSCYKMHVTVSLCFLLKSLLPFSLHACMHQ